jgi:hypothetical protein
MWTLTRLSREEWARPQAPGGDKVRNWGFGLTVLFVGAGLALPGHATVFSIDRTIGSGTVIGTITTDGTLGVLDAANITTWDLALNAGFSSFTLLGPLSGANSELFVTGSGLSATATELVFDFSGDGAALFQFPFLGSNENWYCLEGPSYACTPFHDNGIGTESVQVDGYGNGNNTFGVAHYDASEVIGAAGVAPELPTWALIVAGFAGVGLVARARGRRAAAA